MKKVIVGLSGGVDSSVTAYLLKKAGYAVSGLFMKNWDADDTETYCSAAADLKDATSICDQLDIPLQTVNFSKTYWDKVFTQFLDEYAKGRTPNPDVLCNQEIKFKAFLEHALSLGADYIATGHYAKIGKGYELLKAKDREKDQTYFLHAIEPTVLKKTLFPLGDYLKPEIREIARTLNLTTFDKKDSTGICFIGERRFPTFLNEFLLEKPGPMVSSTGELLGEHQGLMFYTYGQRQGLKIGGKKNTETLPWYVVDKIIPTNTLVVAQGSHHPMLYSQGLICNNIHWLMDSPPDLPLPCFAKTRYRQQEEACLISPLTTEGHVVSFSKPMRAVTPGQYVVFYQSNQCLGGAVIESIIR